MLGKLIYPQYPTTALGLEKDSAAVVQLQRAGRGQFSLRRAATVELTKGVLNPSFDEPNITNPQELISTLKELAVNANLARQKKWSVTLPEAATRSVVMTLETEPATSKELEDVLQWKAERAFGANYSDLRVSRELLSKDSNGKPRYLAVGIRLNVLAEYESIFEGLGWRAGLVMPRHEGEARWLELLTRRTQSGDSLLICSHKSGFTAVLVSKSQPAVVRSMICEPEERDDELYRFLLFYRDRVLERENPSRSLESFLLVGNGFSKDKVREIVRDTLNTSTKSLSADEVGLVNLISSNIPFDEIAAPAGIATFAWS